MTTRLPLTVAEMAFSLMRTASCRCFCPGWMNVRPDVLVLDEADAVGNPAGAAVPNGGIQPGIRHADDHIRLNRMVKREEAARPVRASWTLLPSMTESGRAK